MTLRNDFKDVEWGRAQMRTRSYDTLLKRIKNTLPTYFKFTQYGSITYDKHTYPLIRISSSKWDEAKQSILISGGVHGCEIAGIEAAIVTIYKILPRFSDQFNFAVYPCMNPSSYEIDARWNLIKQDVNRNFMQNSNVEECRLFINSLSDFSSITLSMDLHESLCKDSETMRIQAVDLNNSRANMWSEMPTGYFIYEDSGFVKGVGKKSMGRKIADAVDAIIPICNWPTIAGDINENGVIYYPQGLSPETSDYLAPVALDSFLRDAQISKYAFTSETPDISATGQKYNIQTRASAHLKAIETGLNILVQG